MVKQGAKQLIRTRKHAENLNTMVGSLEGVKMQMQSMATMQAMTRAMKNVTSVRVSTTHGCAIEHLFPCFYAVFV